MFACTSLSANIRGICDSKVARFGDPSERAFLNREPFLHERNGFLRLAVLQLEHIANDDHKNPPVTTAFGATLCFDRLTPTHPHVSRIEFCEDVGRLRS